VGALMSGGRRHLRRANRAGDVSALPESPRHRQWREARDLAAREIERMREVVHVGLDETVLLLDAHTAGSSDAWFELSDRLRCAV